MYPFSFSFSFFFHKDGFVFRIKIMHYREMVLLQQSVATKDGKAKDDKAAKELEREMIHLPTLTSTLHGYVNNVLFFCKCVYNEMNVEFSRSHSFFENSSENQF